MGQASNNPEDFGDFADESDQLDRIHELSWGLFDERLNGEEMAELEDLLENDPAARESYVRCAQLHADLASYFAPAGNSPTAPTSKSPVLGFLNEGMPNLGLPSAEELK